MKHIFHIHIIPLKASLLFCLLNLTLLQTHAQRSWTLQECIDYAYAHNIDILKQKELINQRKIQINTAKNAYLPIVSATIEDDFSIHYPISTSVISTGSDSIPNSVNLMNLKGSVDASMTLLDGGQIKNNRKVAQFNLEVAMAQLDNARKSTGIQVATQYLSALYYQGLTSVSQKQVEVSRQLVSKAQSLVKHGSKPESELAEAQAQLAQDEYQLSVDAGNEQLATIQLAQLITLDNVTDFAISDSSLTKATTLPQLGDYGEAQAIFYKAVEADPSIIAAKAQINAAESNVKVEEGKKRPTLSLIGTVTTQSYEVFKSQYRAMMEGFFKQLYSNHNEVLGVRLSIPIFNGYQTRNAINLAKSETVLRQLELSDARLKLRTEIQQAYYNAQVAANNHTAAVKAENSAHINYNYQVKSYDAGKSTIFDLSQVNQKWVKSQQSVLQTKYDYLIRLRILDFYINKILYRE